MALTIDIITHFIYLFIYLYGSYKSGAQTVVFRRWLGRVYISVNKGCNNGAFTVRDSPLFEPDSIKWRKAFEFKIHTHNVFTAVNVFFAEYKC